MSSESVAVTELLSSKFGMSVTRVERLSSLSNAVYAVTDSDGRRFVFKLLSFCPSEIFRLHERHALKHSRVAESFVHADELCRLERYIEHVEVRKAEIASAPMFGFHMSALGNFNRSSALVSATPNLFYVVERSKARLLGAMASNVERLRDAALRSELTGKLRVVHAVYEHYRERLVPERLVLSHNDCYYRNFLYSPGEARLQLIDFEFAGYNPLGMDVLMLYQDYIFAGESPDPKRVALAFDKLPSDAAFRRFLRVYLFFYKHGCAELPHDEHLLGVVEADERYAEISEDEVDAVLSRFGYFGVMMQIFFIYWELYCCGDEHCEFDYAGYAKLRYDMLAYFLARDGKDIREFESAEGLLTN